MGQPVVINPWLIYQRFFDRRILEHNYDAMKEYVEYLHRHENEGIIAYGLGDWYDIGEKPPGVSQLTSLGVTGTCIYYCDTMILQKVAELLGATTMSIATRRRPIGFFRRSTASSSATRKSSTIETARPTAPCRCAGYGQRRRSRHGVVEPDPGHPRPR